MDWLGFLINRSENQRNIRENDRFLFKTCGFKDLFFPQNEIQQRI